MTEWFRRVFDIISPQMSKNVELCLADILAQLVDECMQIPSEVLEILLEAFDTKTSKLNPAAQRLAVQICAATTDRLQSHVAQYFSENVVTASSEEGVEEKTKELEHLHFLIQSIYRNVPALLLNVMAVLEQELTAEDLVVRQIAVRTLGQMFGDKVNGQMAFRHPNSWKAWLARARDKSSAIRVVWAECIGNIVSHHPHFRLELTPVLAEKVTDPDEKVRATIARVLGTLNYEAALHHVERSLLYALAKRLLDRRSVVRKEAARSLARLYGLAYPEIQSHDPAATKQFAWIPNSLLSASYADAKATPMLIAIFEEFILPRPVSTDDESEWVNRLLLIMKNLDDRGNKALFLRLNNMQTPHSRKPYLPFIEHCEKFRGGAVTENSEQIKKTLGLAIRGSVSMMPDSDKAATDLTNFAKLNEPQLYKLMKVCLSPTTDLKLYRKARSEVRRRVESRDPKLLGTVDHFIRLASYPFVGGSSIPTLLARLNSSASRKSQWRESQIGLEGQTLDSSSATAESLVAASESSQTQRENQPDIQAFPRSAAKALAFISKHCPEMYEGHIKELIRSLSEPGLPELHEETLRALCAAKTIGKTVALDKSVISRLSQIATSGTQMQSKFAARLLALSKGNAAAEEACDDLLNELSGRLPQDEPNRLVSDLSALGQFFKHAPTASQNVWDSVVRDVLKDLSKSWPPKAAESYASDDDWVEDDALDDSVKAKLLGLDVLCKRSISATGDAENAADLTQPVLKLLWRTMDAGEPRALNTPGPVKARLRLQAALCALKLAMLPACDRLIDQDLMKIAIVAQDQCFQVRSHFLHKLLLYLSGRGGGTTRSRRLPTRYNAIPFLVAMDPEHENREMVNTWSARLRALPREERIKKAELTLCRYVHLLAHHPDFSRTSDESMRDHVAYILYYLDCVATENNVGLLFYLAGRLKTVRDGTSQGASENLYTLSEMTQLIIKCKAGKHGWALEQFPGTFKIPSDTGLKALPSPQAQKEVYGTVWLPNSVAEVIDEEVALAEKKVRPPGVSASVGHKRKASTLSGVTTAKTAKSAKRGIKSSPRRSRKRKGTKRGESDITEDEDEGDTDDKASLTTVSSDEEVSDGEAEGRGARTKAQARQRNKERAQRREALAAKRENKSKRRSSTGGESADSELSELSDID